MPENNILIVEDDAILAIHLEDLLVREGYSVITPVATGEEAIKLVRDLHPALILMDIELGGKMNGITAAERIAELDDTPVIFLTGFSQDPLLQQAKITAPYGFLVKPVPERELTATIEMALYKHKLDHKVRESESRYRSLIEQASDGIFLADRLGNFLEINTAASILLGYSQDELLKLNMNDLIPLEDLEETPLKINEMYEGKTVRIERRMCRKDGSLIIAELSGKMLEDGNLQGIVRDITQRKITEEALRKSEEKFSKAFHTSPDSININRLSDGLFIDINSGFTDLTGYTWDDVQGKTSKDISIWVNPEDRNHLVQGLQNHGEVVNLDAQFRVKNGEIKECLMSARTIEIDGDICILSITRDITERKRDELAVRESEEVMHFIIKYDPNAIAVYDNDLHYIAVSDRYLKDYNVLESSIIGKHHYEVFPEMPQRWKDIHQRVLAGSIERNENDYFERPDGSITYNSWECRPWYKSNGEIGGMITYTEVITERKLAEKALRESEEMFRSIFENSPIGISITDLKSNFIAGNPAILNMLGYTLDEYCQLNIKDISHPDDEIKDLTFMDEVISGKRGSFSMVKRNLHKDGHIIWGQLTSTIVFDAMGKPKHTIGMFEDITERKRAEDSLHEQGKLIRTVFDSVPVGIFIVNKEGKITLINPAGLKIWEGGRYAQVDELGVYKGWWRSNGKLISAHEWGSARAVEKGETAMNEEIEIECFNGTHKIIANSAIPLLDDKNNINGAVAVVQDITDRTKAVEALQRRNDYLAAMQVTIYELISQLDLDLLLENLTVRAGQMVHTTSCFLDLVDPISGRLIPKVGKGAMTDSLNHAVLPGEGVAGQVWQTGKPYVINDYDHWDGRVHGFSTTGINSMIGVPLLAGDEILGVLGLAYEYNSGRVFGQEEVDILSQLARLATIAIKNARLYSIAQLELKEREIAEEALRESEERFHQMFVGHNATMLLVSPETGEIIDANPAASRFYGYSIEDLRAMNVSQINLSPAEVILDNMQNIANHNDYNLVFSHRLASGEVRTVEVHSSPIEVKNQKILFSIVHDITERKQAEEQVQQQLDELRRWNAVTLGRETRVMELKHEVNELLKKLDLPQRYNFIQGPEND